MKCGDGKGGYVSTSIPQSQIDNCANSGNEIANINGVLKCGDYTSDKGDVVQEDDLGFAWCSSGADIKHGWGYENGKPCQADPATNQQNWNDHNVNTGSSSGSDEEYPKCANGSSSDGDGDGWGYDNGKSCRV